jgi:hypothetical protein
MQHDRHAGTRELPSGLASGQPAANDMNRVFHGLPNQVFLGNR